MKDSYASNTQSAMYKLKFSRDLSETILKDAYGAMDRKLLYGSSRKKGAKRIDEISSACCFFSVEFLLFFKRKSLENPKKGPAREEETTLKQLGCLFFFN